MGYERSPLQYEGELCMYMSIEGKQNLPQILPVKSDLIFRIFFADERNEEDLICLLKSVLRLPEDDYGEIEITDPLLLPEYIDDKYSIIDVKFHTKSKKVIHIEIQLKVTPELRACLVSLSRRYFGSIRALLRQNTREGTEHSLRFFLA